MNWIISSLISTVTDFSHLVRSIYGNIFGIPTQTKKLNKNKYYEKYYFQYNSGTKFLNYYTQRL